MKILVTAASRHGSTEEIARVIADELTKAGHTVEVLSPDRVRSLADFGAVVAGSAVYMGKWLPAATQFVEQRSHALDSVPIWLFSSGPIGTNPPTAATDPQNVDERVKLPRARGHKVFGGNLERKSLSWVERMAVRCVKAPYGDFREWDAIRAWGREIAEDLRKESIAA